MDIFRVLEFWIHFELEVIETRIDWTQYEKIIFMQHYKCIYGGLDTFQYPDLNLVPILILDRRIVYIMRSQHMKHRSWLFWTQSLYYAYVINSAGTRSDCRGNFLKINTPMRYGDVGYNCCASRFHFIDLVQWNDMIQDVYARNRWIGWIVESAKGINARGIKHVGLIFRSTRIFKILFRFSPEEHTIFQI